MGRTECVRLANARAARGGGQSWRDYLLIRATPVGESEPGRSVKVTAGGSLAGPRFDSRRDLIHWLEL